MLASVLITQCQEMLRDQRGDVYTTAQGIKWLNDAQRMVTLLRPDALTVVESMLLTTDTKQTLPAGRRRLLALVRNAGDDGDPLYGRAIRGPVPQEDMDNANAGWHNDQSTENVTEYVYDDAVPKVFYVYPRIFPGPWYVEAKFSKLPDDVVVESDTIDLDDIYTPAMREWMMYCFFARDDERTPNWERAGRHYTNVFDILQVKLQRDLAVSPKVLEYA